MSNGEKHPSLRLSYEQVKDVLHEQEEIAHNYVNRAISLFSVGTAISGIGLPLLFTRHIPQCYLFGLIPITVFSVIPLLLYVEVINYSWKIIRREFLKTVSSPEKIITEGFLDLEPERFYSDMIQHIALAFTENENIIRSKQSNLIKLTFYTVGEAATLITLALLLSAFGFFG